MCSSITLAQVAAKDIEAQRAGASGELAENRRGFSATSLLK
jgi:hypothetical protein